MNERIKELIKQCTSWSEGSTWTSHEEFDKEKFAELIVRECVEVAGKDWHTPEGWGYTFGQRKAIEFIKEHFGVE